MAARKCIEFLIYALFICLPFLIQIKGIIPDKNLSLVDLIMFCIILLSPFSNLKFNFNDLISAFLMALFCVSILISGAFGNDVGGYIELSIQYFITYVIFFLVLSNYKYLFDKRLSKLFLYSSFISALIISVFYHFGLEILPGILNFNVTGGIFYRVGLTAVNDHAYILAGSVLSYAAFNKNLMLKDILMILFVIYGILLTGSRSAMFFILTSFFIIFLLSNKISPIFKIIFLASISFFIIYILKSFVIDNRIFQNLELTSRLEFLEALEPSNLGLFGGNSANFKLDGVPIHINLIQILLSSGLISLCIYLSWYASLILRSYNKKNTSLIFLICIIFVFYQQIGHIYDRNLFLVFAVIFFSGLNNNYLMQPLETNKKI